MNLSWKSKIENFIIPLGLLVCLVIIFSAMFIDSSQEITDDQYKQLYIECQQSQDMKKFAREYMGDNKISKNEYNKLMQFKLLRNKQTFQNVINN